MAIFQKIEDYQVLNIDFSRAFDAISHCFMIKFLSRLGFPPNYLRSQELEWSTQSGIIKGGSSDDSFPIRRGSPQGEIASGNKFILSVLLLIIVLNKSKNIPRLKMTPVGHPDIDMTKRTTTCYSDDTGLHIKTNNDEQIDLVFKTYRKFQQLTGLSINCLKTEIFSASTKNQLWLDTLAKKMNIKNMSSKTI